MKPIQSTLLTLALLLVGPITAFAADAPNVDELIKQLQGQSPLTAQSPQQLESAYNAALDKLTPDKPEADDAPLQKIVFRASRPGAENERAALARVMAGRLDSANPQVQVVLLRHIQRFGREETVPAVARLLASADGRVRECARRALEANPTRAAADVLRDAIEKADNPNWKAALVSALEYRRDPADAPFFASLAASDDDTVRLPALLALARTGDPSSARVIADARKKGSEAAEAAATDAYLLLADRLASSNATHDDAAKIYKELLAAPRPWKYAAIAGLGNLGAGDENVKTLVDLLDDKDPEARGAALESLARNKSDRVASAVIEKLKSADASAKPALLRALLEQGDKKNAGVFIEAAASDNEAVRVQALRALAELGNASALPTLIKSALAKGEEQQAARTALDNVPGKDVDDALTELAQKGEPPARVEAIRAIGARGIDAAVPVLIKTATDEDASVRSESLRSLAAVADPKITPQAVELVAKARDDGERDQAQRTLVAIARKSDNADQRVAPILAALEQANPPTRAALIGALGQLGGAKSLEAVKAALASTDDKIHEAGVRALSNWPDAGPREQLLALAKDEKKENLAILSLRGYIRMAGIDRDKRKPQEQLALYKNALELARRPDEKKMILGGLAEVRDPRSLEVIAPMLSDEAVSAEACQAAVRVARDTWQRADPTLVRTTLTTVTEKSKDEGQKRAAKEVLEKIEAKQKKPA